MLRTRLVRRAGRLLGAVAVAGVLLAGSVGVAQAAPKGDANGIRAWQQPSSYSHFLDYANGI